MVLYLKVVFQNRKERENFSFYSMWYATQLNLTGYSRYEKENFAYVEMEGKDEQLDRFVEWCRKRPHCSIVDELTVKADKTLRSERI